MHQGKDTVGEGAQEDHHYPFAGKANPKVTHALSPNEKNEQPPPPPSLSLLRIKRDLVEVAHLAGGGGCSLDYTSNGPPRDALGHHSIFNLEEFVWADRYTPPACLHFFFLLQVRLAVIHVDVDGIESGRVKSNPDAYRPVWMDIGGPPPPENISPNGGKTSSLTTSQQHASKGGLNGGHGSNEDKGGTSSSGGGGGDYDGNVSRCEQEIYLARVNWLQDGSLCAQVQNRAQTELRLLRLDPGTGTPTTLLVERSKIWINLHHLLRSLPAPSPQVWAYVRVCILFEAFLKRVRDR